MSSPQELARGVKEFLFGNPIPLEAIVKFNASAEFIELHPDFEKFKDREVFYQPPTGKHHKLIMRWQEKTEEGTFQYSARPVAITGESDKDYWLSVAQRRKPKKRFFIGPDFKPEQVDSSKGPILRPAFNPDLLAIWQQTGYRRL